MNSMRKKNQSDRLTSQHSLSKGVVGIFREEAKDLDDTVKKLSELLMIELEKEYPELNFRYRTSIAKKEINQVLNSLDEELGQELFIENASIIPDGGVVEVQDDYGKWRIILVSEAKNQGRDIENIKEGKQVGPKKDKDLMAAGNAIERSHKNISEIANIMLGEAHFPYVIFLAGSNFLTETVEVERPDGRVVTLDYRNGTLNRLDRLTAASYSMKFNENHCKNKVIIYEDKSMMLQAASMYTKGDGSSWTPEEMLGILKSITDTSLQMLGRDLFKQITRYNKDDN